MPRAVSTGDAKHRERVRRYRKRLHADRLPEADQIYSAVAAAVGSAAKDLKSPISGTALMSRIWDGAVAVLVAQGYDRDGSRGLLLRSLSKKRFQNDLAYGKHQVDYDAAV